MLRKMMCRILRKLVSNIRDAADSASAIEILRSQPFDVVFMDYDLGPTSEENGIEVIRRIKREYPDRRTRYVVVSANAEPQGTIGVDFDAWLTKPVTLRDLKDHLDV